MSDVVFEVAEQPEGGYAADAIGYPIHTFGATLDELRAMVQDAVDCYFTGPEGPPPAAVRLRFVREEVLVH